MTERIVPREQWLYDDRGMMKWMGWLLSDHSAFMENAKQAEKPVPVKSEMTPTEIQRTLQTAFEQNRAVWIQPNIIADGQYVPEVGGYPVTFYAGRVYLEQAGHQLWMIHVETIRHVALQSNEKWWLR